MTDNTSKAFEPVATITILFKAMFDSCVIEIVQDLMLTILNPEQDLMLTTLDLEQDLMRTGFLELQMAG